MIETLFPPHDALIWKSLTVVILGMSVLAILYFLIQIGEGLQVVWTDDFLPWVKAWWTDRNARRLRKRMAEVDRDMQAYRKARR